jgi:hypothetical protein
MHHFVLLQWMWGITPPLASPYIALDGGKRAPLGEK